MTLSCRVFASSVFLLTPHCDAPEPRILAPITPFLSQLRLDDMARDTSHVSVLITVALNQKFGRDIKLQDVINAIDKQPAHPGMMSFYEVRSTIRKLGYDAVGVRFDHPREALPRFDDMMFMIDERTFAPARVMVLVFAVSATTRNILYPNGFVCAMKTDQFVDYFSNPAVLFVRALPPVREPLPSIPQALPTLNLSNLQIGNPPPLANPQPKAE